MRLYEQYINNLNEKASIDWNNYLTSDEVKRFKSKEDADSAGDIIYSKEFKDRLEEFKKSGWTDEQLIDDLLSFNWNNHLNEGIHLFAFVKDEDGNDKVLEDSDYSDKLSFKRDLEANGYKVRRINDEADMYIMDNSDYRSVSEVKSALRKYKSYAKEDGLAIWQDKINYLKDLLNKVSLKESYTLKGIQDGKSFDISYNDNKDKLEKFKDEIQSKYRDIDMFIIEESEKDRNHFELWKKQIDSKSKKELYDYYNRLVSQMKTVDKSDKYNYIDLAKKINYIEDTYKIKNNFSYNLH